MGWLCWGFAASAFSGNGEQLSDVNLLFSGTAKRVIQLFGSSAWVLLKSPLQSTVRLICSYTAGVVNSKVSSIFIISAHYWGRTLWQTLNDIWQLLWISTFWDADSGAKLSWILLRCTQHWVKCFRVVWVLEHIMCTYRVVWTLSTTPPHTHIEPYRVYGCLRGPEITCASFLYISSVHRPLSSIKVIFLWLLIITEAVRSPSWGSCLQYSFDKALFIVLK